MAATTLFVALPGSSPLGEGDTCFEPQVIWYLCDACLLPPRGSGSQGRESAEGPCHAVQAVSTCPAVGQPRSQGGRRDKEEGDKAGRDLQVLWPQKLSSDEGIKAQNSEVTPQDHRTSRLMAPPARRLQGPGYVCSVSCCVLSASYAKYMSSGPGVPLSGGRDGGLGRAKKEVPGRPLLGTSPDRVWTP